MVHDRASAAAAVEDRAPVGGAAADLHHRGGGERGGVRGDSAPPVHAHGHQLLPVQLGPE